MNIPLEILIHIFSFVINEYLSVRKNVIAYYSGNVFAVAGLENNNDKSIGNIKSYGINATSNCVNNILNLRYVCKTWCSALMINSIWYQIYSSVYEQSIVNGLDINKYCVMWNRRITWYEIFSSRFTFELEHITDTNINTVVEMGILISGKSYNVKDNDRIRYWIASIEQYSNTHINDVYNCKALHFCGMSYWNLSKIIQGNECSRCNNIFYDVSIVDKIVQYSFEMFERYVTLSRYKSKAIDEYAFLISNYAIENKNRPDYFDKYSNMSMELYDSAIEMSTDDMINLELYKNKLLLMISFIRLKINLFAKEIIRDNKQFNYEKHNLIISTIDKYMNLAKDLINKYPENIDLICYQSSFQSIMSEYMTCANTMMVYLDEDVMYQKEELDYYFNSTIDKYINIINMLDENDESRLVFMKKTMVDALFNKANIEYNYNINMALAITDNLLSILFDLLEHFSMVDIEPMNYKCNILYEIRNMIINTYYLQILIYMKIIIYDSDVRMDNETIILNYNKCTEIFHKSKQIINEFNERPMKYYLLARIFALEDNEELCRSNLIKYMEMKRVRHRMRWESLNRGREDRYEIEKSSRRLFYIRNINDFITIRNKPWFEHFLQSDEIESDDMIIC